MPRRLRLFFVRATGIRRIPVRGGALKFALVRTAATVLSFQPLPRAGDSGMAEPIWNQFLTERDKAVFATSGYGARAGFGKRPALLVIDVNYYFCGDKPEPILESIKRWRNSCGEEAWVALKVLNKFLDAAHAKGLPVIYTTGIRRDD